MESTGGSINSIILLRILLIAACILSGLLTGSDTERYIVQLPAWHHLDVRIWGEFSRHADLENGLFLYPFEAIGNFAFLPGSSILVFVNKEKLQRAAIPVYASAVLSIIGLILTFFAAPVMLSVRGIGNDIITLQHAFNKFYY